MLEMIEFPMSTAGHRFLEFPANVTQVPDFRRHIRDVLLSLGLTDAELIHTAQLCATELVANSVKAALAEGVLDRSVRLTAYRSRGQLVLEVWDDCAGVPKQATPGELDEGGRGLWLIDMLSHRWGYHRPAGGGKVVWTEISLDGCPMSGGVPGGG